MIIIYLLAAAALVCFFVATYKVIDPNEAHVVVFMGRGRKIYSPKLNDQGKSKTSYFFIPLLMKRFVLNLTNVKMDINDIHLNDSKVAPFVCDVIAWLHISDPIEAAERLNLTQPFVSLKEDLINIVQAVARAVAMKQEVLDIMRDRATFSSSVSAEVGSVLSKWGVELINLEVNDIRDDASKQSAVISNYESMREQEVNSLSRQQNAVREREAVEVEMENFRKASIAKTEANEIAARREIEMQKNVDVANQQKEEEISLARKKANDKQIEAQRALTVGEANVAKEATIEKAKGEAEAIRVKGENDAKVVQLKGEADAAAVQAKGLAEAAAKEKMADAMGKFNEAGMNVEKVRAWIEVEKAKYEALGLALSNADLKLVQSGEGASLFGFPLNAKTGGDLGQMVEAIGMEKIAAFINGKKE